MFLTLFDEYMWSFNVMRLISQAHFGGGQFSEIYETARRIEPGSVESWHAEWAALAERTGERGAAAEAAGRDVSARSLYDRACEYWRMADFMLPPSDARRLAAYERSLACFAAASRNAAHPRERVAVPFEGGSLPAYFIRGMGQAADEPRPTVVLFGGADSTAEELFFTAPGIWERGLACLIVDGPGQGGALRLGGLPTRHDYEVPATAAVDFALTRADVDPDRLVMCAMSLGGYYTPRCAAMDSRYSAAIAWGAIWDYYETWKKRIAKLKEAALPVPADHLLWACGVETYEQALGKLEGFRLEGVAEKVQCPFLLMHGSEDAQVSMTDAQKLFASIGSKDKTFRVFTAEEGGAQHCQRDYLTLAVDTVCDWLEQKFK